MRLRGARNERERRGLTPNRPIRQRLPAKFNNSGQRGLTPYVVRRGRPDQLSRVYPRKDASTRGSEGQTTGHRLGQSVEHTEPNANVQLPGAQRKRRSSSWGRLLGVAPHFHFPARCSLPAIAHSPSARCALRTVRGREPFVVPPHIRAGVCWCVYRPTWVCIGTVKTPSARGE
jgi:hypothetical protein